MPPPQSQPLLTDDQLRTLASQRPQYISQLSPENKQRFDALQATSSVNTSVPDQPDLTDEQLLTIGTERPQYAAKLNARNKARFDVLMAPKPQPKPPSLLDTMADTARTIVAPVRKGGGTMIQGYRDVFGGNVRQGLGELVQGAAQMLPYGQSPVQLPYGGEQLPKQYVQAGPGQVAAGAQNVFGNERPLTGAAQIAAGTINTVLPFTGMGRAAATVLTKAPTLPAAATKMALETVAGVGGTEAAVRAVDAVADKFKLSPDQRDALRTTVQEVAGIALPMATGKAVSAAMRNMPTEPAPTSSSQGKLAPTSRTTFETARTPQERKPLAREFSRRSAQIADAIPDRPNIRRGEGHFERISPHIEATSEEMGRPIKNVQDYYDVLDEATYNIDSTLKDAAQQLSHFRSTINPAEMIRRAFAAKQGAFDTTNVSDRKAVERFIADNRLNTDMRPDQIMGRITRMNADQRKARLSFGPDMLDRHTRMTSDPTFAARETALDVLRNDLFDVFERAGVEGVKDARRAQQALITEKQLVSKRLLSGEKQVPDTGTTSGVRRFAAGLLKATATGAGAAKFGYKGAMAMQPVGERMGRIIEKPNRIVNDLVGSAWRRRLFENPTLPSVPAFQPAGLLGRPAIVTPPPADTSGGRWTSSVPPGMSSFGRGAYATRELPRRTDTEAAPIEPEVGGVVPTQPLPSEEAQIVGAPALPPRTIILPETSPASYDPVTGKKLPSVRMGTPEQMARMESLGIAKTPPPSRPTTVKEFVSTMHPDDVLALYAQATPNANIEVINGTPQLPKSMTRADINEAVIKYLNKRSRSDSQFAVDLMTTLKRK